MIYNTHVDIGNVFLLARFLLINISIGETEGLSGWQLCHRWRHGRLTAYNLWGHQRRQGLHREGFRILVVICLYMLYIIATNILHYLLFTMAHVAAVDCRMHPTSNQLYLMSSLSGNRLFEFCIPLSYDMCIKAGHLLASIVKHLDGYQDLQRIANDICRQPLCSKIHMIGNTKTFLYRPVLKIPHACIS